VRIKVKEEKRDGRRKTMIEDISERSQQIDRERGKYLKN
jgi:tetrahydromethanopterin S-methyltransferase subunit F